MRYCLTFILLFQTTIAILSQYNSGSLHSNFTPTNSVFINPSSILDTKVWLDINIVGAGAYVNNDLVYLKDQKWLSIALDAKNETLDLNEDDISYKQGRKRYHAYNRNFVTGPGVTWNQGDHAAGLQTAFRSYTAARRIPNYVAQFVENGVPPYTPQHDIEYNLQKVRITSLQYAEIKGTYAYTFLKKKRNLFMGGISVSKLFSVGGAAVNIYDFDFLVDNDSLALLFNLQSDLMYSRDVTFNLKGGWGFDLGFTYEKLLSEAASYYPNSPKLGCRVVPYKYKLGVSLMDIGFVKFNQDNVNTAGYDFQDYFWLNYSDVDNLDETNAHEIFTQYQPSIDQLKVKKPFRIMLPTMLSVQYDRNIWGSKLYLNASIMQGLPHAKYRFALRQANLLCVTPRFETYFFEFAMPFSLYEYKYPQLGAALRLGPITLGTDKLWNWLAVSDLYGADIYFHLKIPLRYHPDCKDKFRPIDFINGQKHKKYHPCEAY